MQAQRLFEDVCAGRHKNAPASVEANQKANKRKIPNTAKILSFAIKNMGRCYSKQVARAMGVDLNVISGRFTELVALGMLEKTNERAEGCTILKLVIK